MNKKFSKFLAVGLTTVICLASAVVPVFAAGSNYSETIGTKTGIEKYTTFDKYLVMDEGANVPNVEFAYAITAGQHINYSVENQVFEVLSGVEVDKVTITWDQANATTSSTVKFTSADSTILAASKGETDYVKGLDAGEKYAKHVATVDFSQVVFPEPGVYRYIISETDPSLPGIKCDDDLTRVLDVYVVDDSTDTEKKLAIAGYVLHANADAIGTSTSYGTDGNTSNGADVTSGAKDGTITSDYKSQGFTNEYITHDLTFGKTVAGNQGSRDKYFKFTLTISGALPNTVYTISLDNDGNDNTTDGYNADATVLENAATLDAYEGQTNPSAGGTGTVDVAQKTITTDATGAGTFVFYLQHNQKITVRGLGDTTKYSIEEVPEDYKPSTVISGTDGDVAADETNKALVNDLTTGIKADTEIAYTNTRDGVVPTGVLLTVAPFAALALVGAGGVVAVMGKKKKEENED